MSPSNLPATPEAQLQQELAQHRQYQLQMLQQQQDEEPVEQVHQQQQQQQQQQHNQQQQQQAVLRPQAQQTSGLATPNPQASLEYHRQLLAQRLADKSNQVMASPTDSIMSPCSKMLQQHKMRQFGKQKPRLLNNAFAQRATSNSTEAEKDKENQKRMVATGSGATVTATTTATGPATGPGTGTSTGLFGSCAATPISKDGSIF